MTLIERLTSTPEDRRLFEQERVIFEVTEMISKLMEEQTVSKAELARRLNTSKANITQMLDGRRNMTLRTLVDVMFSLSSTVSVAPRDLTLDENWYEVTFRVRSPLPDSSLWRIGQQEILRTQSQPASSAEPSRMVG